MKKGSTTELGGKNRQRILDAAIELVAEHGFVGTSVNHISKRAGIAKTALYWHFDNKSGLMAAVIEEVTQQWIDEIQSGSRLAGSPDQRKDKLLDALRDILKTKSDTLRVLLMAIMERNTVDPRIQAGVLRATNATIHAIAKGIEDAIGTELPDADLIGHTVLAMLEAALRRRLMEPDCDLDRLVDDIGLLIDLMVRERLSRIS